MAYGFFEENPSAPTIRHMPSAIGQLVLAHYRDYHAANGEVFVAHDDGLHGFIRRHEADLVALVAVELFDRRLAVDQGHHSLSIVRCRPLFDDDVVAVADPVFDHRIAFDAENKSILPPDELLRDHEGLGVL